MTVAQSDLARNLYDQGLSVAEIAELDWCNVHPSTVYYHLKGSGEDDTKVTMRQVGRKGLSPTQHQVLVEQFDAGLTVSAIKALPEMQNDSGKAFASQTLSKALKASGRTPQVGRPKKAAPEAVEAAPEAPSAPVRGPGGKFLPRN